MNTPDSEAQAAEFVRLLTAHQLDIYLYVHSLMPDPNEAAEIVQDANVVLWEKREQFVLGTDFRAWAFQIARYRLLKQLRKRKLSGLCFSDALIDELSLQAPRCAAADAELIDGLRRCIHRLAARDRELLSDRYTSLLSCEKIAESLGRPVRWVYNALSRIRHELFDCMTHSADTRRGP